MYFPQALELVAAALAHKQFIVFSSNNAPNIVRDKSLGNGLAVRETDGAGTAVVGLLFLE